VILVYCEICQKGICVFLGREVENYQ